MVDNVKIMRCRKILESIRVQYIVYNGEGTFISDSLIERIEIHTDDLNGVDIGKVIDEAVANLAVGAGDENGFFQIDHP